METEIIKIGHLWFEVKRKESSIIRRLWANSRYTDLGTFVKILQEGGVYIKEVNPNTIE